MLSQGGVLSQYSIRARDHTPNGAGTLVEIQYSVSCRLPHLQESGVNWLRTVAVVVVVVVVVVVDRHLTSPST